VTDRESFVATADGATAAQRVPVEVSVEVADPFDAYRRVRTGEWDAFLETTGGQDGWGYLAVDPVDRLTVAPDAEVLDGPSPSLAALEGVLTGETLVRGDCDVPYPCGAIGWLSYDIARELESLPGDAADDRGLPRLQVGVYDRIAAWREPRDEDGTTLRVTACPRVGDDPARVVCFVAPPEDGSDPGHA